MAQPVAVASTGAAVPGSGDWPLGGHDAGNTRSNPVERTIDATTAARLVPRWAATTTGSVSATPAVVAGAVYVPDWGGTFWKLDAGTGRVIWAHQISEYDGVIGSISRTSPAVVGNTVYLGDQNGAHLLAVDTATGALRWRVQLDSHPAAVLTQSPMVVGGIVYQGVSSVEETDALDPAYPCCTFRGSLAAVSATTGRVLWRTFTVPDNGGKPGGYSGGAVWGGTPVVDAAHHTVYVTTGNNYTVPAGVKACQQAGNPPASCLAPDDHIDAIAALDTGTGRIRWVTGTQRFDDWTAACITGLPPNNCPQNPGSDYDFGDGPHLLTVPGPDGPRQIIGSGEKSGQYWALDARTGAILWSAAPGPGSPYGGIQWGSATDGTRIYLAEANANRLPYQLPDGRTTISGSFAALDPATGRILWQLADPHGGIDLGAVSTANGVVYAGSLGGWMYAIDATDGTIVWSQLGLGSSNAGPSISNGVVYWGNGYGHVGLGTPATVLYAFAPAASAGKSKPAGPAKV